MQSQNYLVTCIITTKNRPELIVRAVTSVLQQSYRNIEIVLVDDSDGCETQKVVLKFTKQLKYIKNDKSRGACYSRNVGLSESGGDFIAFLDDDDFWMPKKIERQLQQAMKYPLVGCNYFSYLEGKKYYFRRPEFVKYEEMLYCNYLGSCSFVLAEASTIKSCHFDESMESGQDWDMWLSVIKKNKIERVANINEYLVDYNQGQHLRITSSAKYMRTVFLLYEKNIDEFTPFISNMFGLYNMIKADNSLFLWVLKELSKARLKRKSLIFLLKILFKRLFGIIEIF